MAAVHAAKTDAPGPEHFRIDSASSSENGESDISWDLISVSGLTVSSDASADTAEIDDLSSLASFAHRSVASTATISSVTLSEKSEDSDAGFQKID
jgi:hypothetical protein